MDCFQDNKKMQKSVSSSNNMYQGTQYNKYILNTELPTAIQDDFSTERFDEEPLVALSTDLSPSRDSEKSPKKGSLVNKCHSFKTGPQIPIIPNRTDSILSMSSLSPLGAAMPMTPTPVASKYDLRMYPQIMEYARIVHWSQREKQKAQARGENVQKWRLPQIPFCQSLPSHHQVLSTIGNNPQVNVLAHNNGEAISNSGLTRTKEQVHLFAVPPQQQLNNFALPLQEQQKYESSLSNNIGYSLCCSSSPLASINGGPTATGNTGEFPLIIRGTRLSTQNTYYPSNHNTINNQIAPLFHLGQSNNSADVQTAAVALRLYLQAEQQRKESLKFDASPFTTGCMNVTDCAFSHSHQNQNIYSSYGEAPTIFFDVKHSTYLNEDLETLSPSTPSEEITTSFAPFFNSPKVVGFNTNDAVQDEGHICNPVGDTALPAYLQTQLTSAESSQINSSSPPTHLAAMSSCLPTPSTASLYQHLSPNSVLTRVTKGTRVAKSNHYKDSLSSENDSQTNFVSNKKSNVCLKDNSSKLTKILSTSGCAGQQPLLEQNNGNQLTVYPGNVNSQILDQLYFSKQEDVAQGVASKITTGMCLGPHRETNSTPVSKKPQTKQVTLSNDVFKSVKLPMFNADGSAQLAEKFPANAVLEWLGSNGIQNIKSHGSLLHPQDCKPCAFFWTKGCQNGQSCKFCHEWHAPKKKKPMKDQRNLMIIARPDGKIEYIRCSLNEALVACNVN